MPFELYPSQNFQTIINTHDLILLDTCLFTAESRHDLAERMYDAKTPRKLLSLYSEIDIFRSHTSNLINLANSSKVQVIPEILREYNHLINHFSEIYNFQNNNFSASKYRKRNDPNRPEILDSLENVISLQKQLRDSLQFYKGEISAEVLAILHSYPFGDDVDKKTIAAAFGYYKENSGKIAVLSADMDLPRLTYAYLQTISHNIIKKFLADSIHIFYSEIPRNCTANQVRICYK